HIAIPGHHKPSHHEPERHGHKSVQSVFHPTVPVAGQFGHGRMSRQHRYDSTEELTEQHGFDKPGARYDRGNSQQDKRQSHYPRRFMRSTAVVTMVVMSVGMIHI